MIEGREAVAKVAPGERRAPFAYAWPLVVPAAIGALAAAGLAAASIRRHDSFGSNAFDLGIVDQTIWGYSNLEPTLDNTVLGTPNLLGDHFEPIVAILAPLYWIWPDVRMLLVAQAVLLALASLPIFLWARQVLGQIEALAFQVAFLAFWGVLAGNIYDFHELALAAPVVSLALYAMLTGRTKLLLAACLLALLAKENLALTIVAIGAYLALVDRRWKLGLALAGVATAAFVALLKVVIPAVTGRAYAHWLYPALGSGPERALVHVLTRPLDTLQLFVTPRSKMTALFNLLAPWLLLPLVSPLLIVAIPTLAERFLASKPAYWSQGFHYNLVLAPVLAFAAVDTTRRLSRYASGRAHDLLAPAIAVTVLLVGLYFSFGRLKPLDELGRYTSASHAAEIRLCLATIPPSASVAATSALVPHLTHRREVYLLDRRPRPMTDYLAVDTYTWTFPLRLPDIRRLLERALDEGYGVVCTKGGTAVLERGAERGSLSPELRPQG